MSGICKVKFLVACVGFVFLTGCDDPAPETRLIFPPPNSQFSGSEISFRGEVKFSDNDLITVTLQDENFSVEASTDAASDSWDVPAFELSTVGISNLTLTAENDRSGIQLDIPVRLDRNAFMARMTNGAATSEAIYVADARLNAIITVDRQTGLRSILSDHLRGSGPNLSSPVAVSSVGESLYVLDNELDALLLVNRQTGDRQIVSDSTTGIGPVMVNPRVFLIEGGTALVADAGLDAIVQIDLDSGDRQVVYDRVITDGPIVLSPQALLRTDDGRLLLLDDIYAALIEIDLNSNDFSVVSNTNVGDGPNLSTPRDFVQSQSGEVLVLDPSFDSLVRIDLASGDRAPTANLATDVTEEFDIAVALTAQNAQGFVLDNRPGSIISVNLETFERNLVSQVEIGSGTRMGSPNRIEQLNNVLLVTDEARDTVTRINYADGGRQDIITRQANELFNSPDFLDYDPIEDVIYVSFSEFDRNGVLAFDRQSQTARVLSSPTIGTGIPLILPSDLALHSSRSSLLVFDVFRQRLLTIELSTLQRTIVSDQDDGNGVRFGGGVAFAYDDVDEIVYVLDADASRIVAVDLLTGARTLIQDRLPNRRLTDIELDRNGERLLLVDSELDELISLDLQTSSITQLSGSERGSGMSFDRPTGLTYLIADDLVAVTDGGLDAVMIVDLPTGDRVILSY